MAFAALLLVSRTAGAQSDPVFDAKGFQQNRDYFSQVPYEHIDTLSGSLVLTFTDLVLPGNGGRDLRFQRTYNSKSGAWKFGLAGMVMQVNDTEGPPLGSEYNDNYLPHLITADGAEHQTIWLESNAWEWVITAESWRDDRVNRALYLPDGTRCYPDSSGRLIEILDPFGGGEILDWSPVAPAGDLVSRAVWDGLKAVPYRCHSVPVTPRAGRPSDRPAWRAARGRASPRATRER